MMGNICNINDDWSNVSFVPRYWISVIFLSVYKISETQIFALRNNFETDNNIVYFQTMHVILKW